MADVFAHFTETETPDYSTQFTCPHAPYPLAAEVNIPVSGINIGAVHKKDVLRANVMNEKSGFTLSAAVQKGGFFCWQVDWENRFMSNRR